MELLNLLLLTAFGGVFSLAGGFIMLKNSKVAKLVSHVSAPFAAGSLVATVFFDLLPEALSEEVSDKVFFWVLIGIVGFFLLERRLGWFHHHHEHKAENNNKHRLPAMLVIGDTVHNAIDGAAIAVAFLAHPTLGIVTAFAVALHEIPQEIGDFGLLLKAGWDKQRVLRVNLLSAMASVAAAVFVYAIGLNVEQMIAPALGLISGMLLYIALSDVLPTVHETKSGRKWFDNASLLFVAGIIVVYCAVNLTHKFVDDHHGDEPHTSEVKSL
jgi:zinc and cadmium transporter